MGGGAGITIAARFDGFYITPKARNVVQVTVKDFDAAGYQDGMREIRGDLLKATACLELSKEDLQYLKDKYQVKRGEHIWVNPLEAKAMVFSGYVRGDIRKQFPLTLKGSADVEGLGEMDIAVEIEPRNVREFGYMWGDVFGFFADPVAIDSDGEPIPIEIQYEDQDFDNRENWGARAK